MSLIEQKIIAILRKLDFIGCLVLVILMILVSADITLRSIFGIAIRGNVEFITSFMVILVFLGIPLRCYTNEQIKVDFIDQWAKKSKKRGFVLNSINYLLVLAFFSLMVWQSTLYALHLHELGIKTTYAGIPVYMLIYLIAFSYLCAFLGTLLAAKDLWLGGKEKTEVEDLKLSSIK